nr:uncharacterized protein LOC110438611 isoform X1 [Danio rerio]XP_021327165.1 uncharacterized protein LOC110438611 isoform X1 [Danio rerio]XP_021327166.1 uncharacterized protein LOC110438611 isoform X1 [Danio rerio]|eukprot:XP_021327164.1 uncharacterized protein LOC110438611 isoform X1 [Danio rerio]
MNAKENPVELKKPTFCSHVTVDVQPLPDPQQFTCFKALVEATALLLHGAAGKDGDLSAVDYQSAERNTLRKVQIDCFPDDINALVAGKPVPSSSRLITLAPEYDSTVGLIRVGGRLRRSHQLDADAVHPIVLDPSHKITQLLIQNIDKELHHPGAERVFAEIRRKYWILRGREAVKRQQHLCPDCQRWRAKPTVPQMADLPQARYQIFKPPFFSTGMDCFGPFTVKLGRRSEKRWGILFKCLTTRAVHIDLLSSLDTDSFLICHYGASYTGEGNLQSYYQIKAPTLKGEKGSSNSHSHPCVPHCRKSLLNNKFNFDSTLPVVPILEEYGNARLDRSSLPCIPLYKDKA